MQIARMNALLSATAAGFSQVFSKAQKDVESFGSSMTSIAGKISGIGAAIGAGAAVYTIVSLTKASFENIDALKDQAEAIGVSTDALSRLQYAAQFAGVDATSLGTTIGKMVKNLADAASGGGEAAAAIQKMGLDANALTAMSPDQAFAKIAGAIAQIDNPYERATAASQIFGKQWQSLIPILNKGEAGLNKLAAESDKLGFTVSAVDAAKVEAAADSFDRVHSMITGAANAAAIELSPYLEVVANKLLDIGTAGGGMGGIVVSAIEGVAKGIAYAADYLELFKAGWYLLEAGVLAVAGGLIKSIDYVGQGLVALANLIPGVELTWTDSFSSMADSFANDVIAATGKAGTAFDKFQNGTESAKVGAFFDDVRKKAQEAADAAANAGPKPFKPIQQEDTEQVKEAEKAYKEAEKAAKSYYDATRTPAEKYAAEIQKINELLAKGLLDPDTAFRATSDAAKKLQDQTKGKDQQPLTDPGGPQLMQAGSQAAASFVAKIGRQQFADTENKQQLEVAKKQAATAEQSRELLAKISNAIGGVV